VSSQPHSGGAQQPQEAQQSRGSRIDRYVDRYAARAQGMVASEIRALFAVAARPEIVSLAGGMPFIAALPLDVVGEMAGQLVADRGAVALQHGTGQGGDQVFFLKVNVAPGMTETSTLPMALQAAGLDLGVACRDLLCLAAARGS
jgi:D-ala D-ala ligase C-terminus